MKAGELIYTHLNMAGDADRLRVQDAFDLTGAHP